MTISDSLGRISQPQHAISSVITVAIDTEGTLTTVYVINIC